MNQDALALRDRLQQQNRIIPLDGPADRATGFDIRFDGGGFTLHVYENRESIESRQLGATIEDWTTIEIARFSVGPLSLRRLSDQIVSATAVYESVMGHSIPDEHTVNERLLKVIADAMASVRASK